MKSRHKKLALIGGALAVIGIIAALVLNALNSNIALYITPTEVAAGKAPQGKLFRIGGLVKEGSIQRQADGVTIAFVITDTAQGRMTEAGTFAATEVLAKHDENYMPPEAAKAVDDAQKAANKHVSPSSAEAAKAGN